MSIHSVRTYRTSQEVGCGGVGWHSLFVIHLQFPMEKCVGCHHDACTISDKLKACLSNYWVGIYTNMYPCVRAPHTVV